MIDINDRSVRSRQVDGILIILLIAFIQDSFLYTWYRPGTNMMNPIISNTFGS